MDRLRESTTSQQSSRVFESRIKLKDPLANSPNNKPKAEPFKKPQREHAQAQHVKKSQNKNPNAEPVSNRETAESDEGEFWPLSGKPYFNMILAKSHVKPSYQPALPTKIYPVLPYATIPMVLNYCGKSWELIYLGESVRSKRFDRSWNKFVVDNDLKVGDACVFELTECSHAILKFKVQILRGDFPSELLAKVDGENPNSPIIIE